MRKFGCDPGARGTRMSTPTPREMELLVDNLRIRLADLEEDYRWAHGAAFKLPSRGFGAGRNPGPADPTGNAAMMDGLRKACYQVAARLKGVQEDLDSALGLFEKAFDRLDSHAIEVIGPRVHPADIAEARGAKIKRMARGEGWGVG